MRLIKLFSLLILFVGIGVSQQLTENIAVKVKVIGELDVEKPKEVPPKTLSTSANLEVLELSHLLLEPPKGIEKVQVKKMEGSTFSCGEPSDRVNYRKGVKAYLEGRYGEAKEALLNVLAVDASPFRPMASYILGVIYADKGKHERALNFFKSGCDFLNVYRDASCESYYALYFKLKGTPAEAPSEYPLWEKVHEIKVKGSFPQGIDCSRAVFKRYCGYIRRFVAGEMDDEYPDSTSIRSARLLLDSDPKKSLEILKEYIKPLSKNRDIALYYYSLALIKLGKIKEALGYISVLETLNQDYAKSLYALIAKADLGYSLLAYKLTGNKELLNIAGVIAYNRGDYRLAMDFFEKAGNLRYAAYSALMLGDYGRALHFLERESASDREHFKWLLEAYLQTKDYESLGRLLERVRGHYPDLYEEYAGWYFFKKKDWERAARYLPDGYLRAVALYNAGRYREVLSTIGEPKNLSQRLLLARAAISVGDGDRARLYLTGDTDEELYLRGMSYFIEGRYKEAIDNFSLIGAQSPYRVRALLKIADSYYNSGDLDNAKNIYMGLLKSFPDSPEAKEATLALVQIELQNPSADLKELISKFIEQFPDSPLIPDLYYQLANLYLKEGNREEAKRVFRVLTQYENYRSKALLKLAQLEESPEEKEKILLELMEAAGTKVKEQAVNMLKELYKKEGQKEKLAQLLLKGGFEDKKEALKIYAEIDIEKAQELLQELIKEDKEDEDLTRVALLLFKKTGKPSYLKMARNSTDKRVKAEALYLLGKHLKRKKKSREALESFLEVILSAKGLEPYYNQSVLEAADILISLNARSDASCLLDRLDSKHLTEEQLKRVKILKSELPKCSKKKGG